MSKDDKTLSEKSIIEAPIKTILLTIPFIITLFLGWWLLGIEDVKSELIWGGFLFLCTIVVLPVGTYLFRGTGSGGFILTTTLGIVAVSLFVWTFSYIQIYRFTTILVYFAMLVIGFICYYVKPLRQNFIKEISKPFYIEKVTLELTVFMTALTILCYYKGFTPMINGQEKFMDYGFIMSMLRNPKLPASDMWLSGYNINYYYFGQFMWSLVIKGSGVAPQIGYNIAMVSAIALPFAMCFSIGTMLFDHMSDNCNHVKGFWSSVFRYVTGIFAGFTVMLFGNSHSFFYDENSSVGNKILNFLGDHGVNVGSTTGFYYPDSTRYIGHNPDSQVFDDLGKLIDEGDYTIEEFPFYSYLVSDLHAHVISVMVVLLIIGIALAFLTRTKHPDSYEFNVVPKRISQDVKLEIFRTEYKRNITPELVAISVLLGVAQQTNFWDFLIYFVFGSMTLLLVNTRRSKVFTDISSFICFAINVACILIVYVTTGGSPFLHVFLQLILLGFSYLLVCFEPSALTRTSFGMSFMFTAAFIVALPFNANFDMISNKLGKTTHTSSLFQLTILWGTHILVALAFILFTILFKNYNLERIRSRRAPRKDDKDGKPSTFDRPKEGFTNPVAGFIGRRNIVDVFICGMIVVGIMLLIAPEIFYVRDIYTGGYLRANTMFKFTFAGFIMLSLAISYATMRMLWITTSKNTRSASTLITGIISFCLIILIPGHYMILGLEQRCGDLSIKSNYKGLDGTDYLNTYYSEDSYLDYEGNLVSYLQAINWLNENVSGSHVILEAYGDSYTDNNIVSAYTGMPTVIGWQTHEWLWRFHGIVDKEHDLFISDPNYDVWELYLTPRYNDVNTVYESNDIEAIKSVIRKYNIEYIVLGNLEYGLYDYDNTYTLMEIGEVVFNSENLNIFKVDPAILTEPGE